MAIIYRYSGLKNQAKHEKEFIQTYFDKPIKPEPKPTEKEVEVARKWLKKRGII